MVESAKLIAGLIAMSAGASATCSDAGDHCRDWAAAGECTKNPGYMRQNCRQSCHLCGDAVVGVDASGRQTLRRDASDAVDIGDITRTFERAVDDFAVLKPTLLSQAPKLPVLQLDRFASDDEVATLLRLIESAAWQHSELEIGSSQAKAAWRTSSSAYCDRCTQELPALFERAVRMPQWPCRTVPQVPCLLTPGALELAAVALSATPLHDARASTGQPDSCAARQL